MGLMIYLFIGVAIASDKFMESIEMITAQEKEVSVKDPRTGKTQVVVVKVWNETVANLTLMLLDLPLLRLCCPSLKSGPRASMLETWDLVQSLVLLLSTCS